METIKINSDIKKRLDVFIVEYYKNSCNRSFISSLIEKGKIRVNDKIQKSSYKLKTGDLITIEIEKIDEKPLSIYEFELDIKYEDDDLLVINKPKNMLCHPTKYDSEKTLSNALLCHCKNNLSDISGANRLGIVHRLDKNTAGLIICAKNNEAHIDLARQIKEKSAKRKYLAISLGQFDEHEGIIDKALKHSLKDDVKMIIAPDNEGISAITHYKVLEQFSGAALVELELKTGRTHQIRAHLASINHPIFGDNLYGAKSYMKSEFHNLKTHEQLLQSYFISFIHPKTKKYMEFQLEEKDFSEDFIKVLNFLRRKNEH